MMQVELDRQQSQTTKQDPCSGGESDSSQLHAALIQLAQNK